MRQDVEPTRRSDRRFIVVMFDMMRCANVVAVIKKVNAIKSHSAR